MPPRSRSSGVPQRPSLRGSNSLRTSSSDSDPSHNRPVTDRSPRLGDRRSLRGTQLDSLNQKKLGTRIADLESQLGQAQKELKVLKNQLVSAEAAKKDAQQQLSKKSKKTAAVCKREVPVRESPTTEAEDSKEDSCISGETSDVTEQEPEVSGEASVERKSPVKVPNDSVDQLHKGNELPDASTGKPHTTTCSELEDELKILKAKLEEKEKELEARSVENEGLKNQLSEASSKVASAVTKEEEMSSRLSKLGEELEASKAIAAELTAKLESSEGAKEALEAEIKKMTVQTEQWRKAADAAAAVLASNVETNGRISERCGSMDKHFGGSIFQTPADGYTSFVGSPGMADDLDDGFRGSKHKGSSGIRVFGDLWKRKSQK